MAGGSRREVVQRAMQWVDEWLVGMMQRATRHGAGMAACLREVMRWRR